MRARLLTWFVVVGLLPLSIVGYWAYSNSFGKLVRQQGLALQMMARGAIDKIDRNLFERYGDVQAFTANPRALGPREEVTELANLYTRLYGIYDLMVVADAEGVIVAANTQTYDGRPLDTSALIGRSVKGQEWFDKTASGGVEAGASYIADLAEDPLVKPEAGQRALALNFSAPIRDASGRIVRVWSNRASWERIVRPIVTDVREEARALGIADLETQIVSRDGLALDDADPKAILSVNLADRGVEAVTASRGGKEGYTTEPHEQSGTEQINGYAGSRGALGFAGYGWTVLARGDLRDAVAGARADGWFLLGLIALSAVLVVGLALWIANATARPLAALASALQRVAQGDLEAAVEVHSQDEIGQVERAAQTMIGGLREVITQVSAGSDQITTASRELSGAAEQLAGGAQHQAASLEQTAASLEQITATVKQNADNARTASQLASGSRDTAEKGGEVVETAVAAMADINQSSKRIADITTAIDEIAFQTNLLALNAAVEAARAGEQGRGFAVVASEVRSLAQRSAVAAKEIKELIQDSVGKIENGAGRVQRSGETLHEIVTSVKRVTDIVAEISAASQEQSAEIHQVTKSVAQMDQVVQSNSAQTEELSATAEALASQAVQLQGIVRRFRVGPNRSEASAAASSASSYSPSFSPGPASAAVPAAAHAASPREEPALSARSGSGAPPVVPGARRLPPAALAIDDSFEEF